MAQPAGWFSKDNAQMFSEFASAVPHGGTVVEVGVYLGRSLSSLVDVAVERGLNVYAVDAWNFRWRPGGRAKRMYSKERIQELGEHHVFERFQQWLRSSPLHSHTTIIREESWLAARQFENSTVDLIHIDGNHRYESVLLDLHAWHPKMKPGSSMIGHDFDNHHPGVVTAVNRYFGASSVRSRGGMWFITL